MLLGCTVAVTLAVATVAAAAPARDGLGAEAKAHFSRGQKLVEAKHYLEAYAEFEAGYVLTKRPAFLFNMGESARLGGDTRKAREAYQRYLREAPHGNLADVAHQRLDALGGEPAPIDEPTPDKAKPVTPDKVTPDKATPDQTAEPKHVRIPVVRIEDKGTDPARERRPPAAHGSDGGSRPIWRRWPFWAAVGGAVVVGSAAVYFATRKDSCPGNCVDLR
jgi:hypothetical protein